MTQTFKSLGEDLLTRYGVNAQDTEGACLQVAWAAVAALAAKNKLPPGAGEGKSLQCDLVTIGYLKAKEMLPRFDANKGTLRQFLYRQVLGHIQIEAWKEYTPNDASRRQRNVQVFSLQDVTGSSEDGSTFDYNSLEGELAASDDYYGEEERSEQEQEDTIRSLVKALEPTRREIICRYYGVLGYEEETIRELSARFECSIGGMHAQIKSIEQELTRRATNADLIGIFV